MTAPDRILDFTNGENKLDFRGLDADPVLAGRQALSFIGTSAFGANGTAQLRYADSGAIHWSRSALTEMVTPTGKSCWSAMPDKRRRGPISCSDLTKEIETAPGSRLG